MRFRNTGLLDGRIRKGLSQQGFYASAAVVSQHVVGGFHENRKLPLSLLLFAGSHPVAGLEFPPAYHEVLVPAYQYEAGLDNLLAYRIWQSPGLPDLLPDYCRLSHKIRGLRLFGESWCNYRVLMGFFRESRGVPKICYRERLLGAPVGRLPMARPGRELPPTLRVC